MFGKEWSWCIGFYLHDKPSPQSTQSGRALSSMTTGGVGSASKKTGFTLFTLVLSMVLLAACGQANPTPRRPAAGSPKYSVRLSKDKGLPGVDLRLWSEGRQRGFIKSTGIVGPDKFKGVSLTKSLRAGGFTDKDALEVTPTATP